MSLSPYWLLLLTLLVPLPFNTDRRGRRTPWVTYILIALNVLAYCFTGLETYARWGWFQSPAFYRPADRNLRSRQPRAFVLEHGVFVAVWAACGGSARWEAFLALYLGGGIAAGCCTWHYPAVSPKVVVPLWGVRGDLGDHGPVCIGSTGADPAVLAARPALRSTWDIEVPAVAGVCLWMLQNIGGGIFSLEPAAAARPTGRISAALCLGLVAAELTGLLRTDARTIFCRMRDTGVFGTGPGPTGSRAGDAGAVRDFWNTTAGAGGPLRPGSAGAGPAAAAFGAGASALAGALEAMGEPDGAVVLLSALTEETPDAPEDEMARLKLGQLLRKRDRRGQTQFWMVFLPSTRTRNGRVVPKKYNKC
ncbi:MAG: hypothetical protein FRX48_09197 [Lasallia pustulata]|uniref:Uncharacterized protein n=1 Tax=Lasallia pustulata TaxID=136370 RepID=A0A5M8PCZ5_9LECA|nr:MAG: hypothetical protein FRX48_09197 [Lasallia pustulata]